MGVPDVLLLGRRLRFPSLDGLPLKMSVMVLIHQFQIYAYADHGDQAVNDNMLDMSEKILENGLGMKRTSRTQRQLVMYRYDQKRDFAAFIEKDTYDGFCALDQWLENEIGNALADL